MLICKCYEMVYILIHFLNEKVTRITKKKNDETLFYCLSFARNSYEKKNIRASSQQHAFFSSALILYFVE